MKPRRSSGSANVKAVKEWKLQDARNHFGAVVDAALCGEPQHVTRRGKPAVVVLSCDDYERLKRMENKRFVELLLSMPQDDGEFERITIEPRAVEH